MCLYTSRNKPFIAKDDIVCYKYLDIDGFKYITPYTGI